MNYTHIFMSVGAAAILCACSSTDKRQNVPVPPVTPDDFVQLVVKKHTTGYLKYRNADLCKELFAFYYANQKTFNDAERYGILRKMFEFSSMFSRTDRQYYDCALALLAEIPDIMPDKKPNDAKINFLPTVVCCGLGNYSNEDSLICAEEFYEANKNRISPTARLRSWMYPSFVRQIVKFRTDQPKVEYFLEELLNLKYDGPADNPGEIIRFEQEYRRQIQLFFNNLIVADSQLGLRLVEKYQKSLTDADFGPLCVSFCQAAIKELDRPLLDKYLAKSKAIKDPKIRFATLEGIAVAAGQSPVGKELFSEQWNSAATPDEKMIVLSDTVKSIQPYTFQYGFNKDEEYPEYLAQLRKLITFVKENPSCMDSDKYMLPLHYALEITWIYGDYATFETVLKENLSALKFRADAKADRLRKEAAWMREKQKNPENAAKKEAEAEKILRNYRVPVWNFAAKNLIRKGDLKAASEILAELPDSDRSAQEKQNAANIRYFTDGGTFDGFDAAFASLKLNSEQKMNAIREAGRFFFSAQNFETARKLNAEIMKKMFVAPDVNKHTSVKYLPDAPKTAEAWAKSPAYQDWSAMETRFSRYAGYENKEDRVFLKDAPITELPEAYKAGLQIVYDDESVHIYLRINDPDAKEVSQRKRLGPLLEWLFRPGDSHAYHSFFFKGLPDTSDDPMVNWAAPTKHYRLTYDGIQKDSVVTPEGYAAHVVIPWIFVWDKFPSNDNVWRLGLQIWGKKDSRSLSGLVHELSRTLMLDFQFSKEERIRIQRSIAIQAFNTYNAIRKDAGGTIQNWNDPYLGDPEFYSANLKDFIAELDDAGKKLTASASDSEIPAIYEKYVPLWAEIKYVLEEKRAAWLRDSLFRKK